MEEFVVWFETLYQELVDGPRKKHQEPQSEYSVFDREGNHITPHKSYRLSLLSQYITFF